MSEPFIVNNTRGGDLLEYRYQFSGVVFLSRLTTRRVGFGVECFAKVEREEGRRKGRMEEWIKALFAFCSGTKYRTVLLVAYRYFEHGVEGRKVE